MARINVEEKWWSTAERSKLGKLLRGVPFDPEDLTETVMIRAWRCAQEYWQNGQLIPGSKFMAVLGADRILLARLARVHAGDTPDSPIVYPPSELRFIERYANDIERAPNEIRTALERYLNDAERNWIYVNGSEESFRWALNARKQRVEAGKKSAESRKKKYGTSQPIPERGPNETRTAVERDSTAPNEEATKVNETERSVSGSGSVSGSRSGTGTGKSNGGIRAVYPEDYETMWKAYGIKGDKKAAYEVWKGLRLTDVEQVDLGKAMRHYHEDNPDPQFRKDFERFLKMDWRPWIQGPQKLKAPLANGHAHSNPFLERLKNAALDGVEVV